MIRREAIVPDRLRRKAALPASYGSARHRLIRRLVAAFLILSAFPSLAADPVYNPFTGAPAADARPPPAAAMPPLIMPTVVPPQEPVQPRVPAPRDLTVVAAHGRVAILRTQTGRYPVKDGEVLTLEGARYRSLVKDGTVRLVEIESNLVAFEGYVGAGMAPEQRNQSRRPGNSGPTFSPQMTVPQPGGQLSYPLSAPQRTPAAQLPPLPFQKGP